MKKYLKLIFIALSIIISAVIISKYIRDSNLVYKKIIKLNNDMKVNEIREINLHDYTSFEWDTVLIYNSLMGNSEISDYLGYNYDKYYDISSGWMFLKDNKIVYEEEFPLDGFPIREVSEFYISIKDIKQNKGNLAFKNEGYFLLKKIYSDNSYVFRLIE